MRRVNAVVRGWSGYFYHANCTRVWDRHRRWLWRKFDRKRAHCRFSTDEPLHGLHGLWPMPLSAPWNR